jgi:hypothetical protein
MPAKRCKKNAQFGLADKLGAEWRWYGKKISTKHRRSNVGEGKPLPHGCLDQTRIEVPVISLGFSNPISINMVGATSASTPPSRTLKSRLPT